MSEQQLAVKTVKNSILNIASFVIGLAVNFYLLRFVVAEIGIESYGISALLLVIIAPLTLTNLGFGEATTKYVAEHVHAGNYAKAGAYIRTTFLMNLMVGLAGGIGIFFFGGRLVMAAFSQRIDSMYIDAVYRSMQLIGLGWLVNQCAATFMSVPVALQRFRHVAMGNLVYVIATAFFTYVLLRQGYGLVGYTLATVSGQTCALMYWYITARSLMAGVSLAPRIDREAWKQSFHYGGWQTVSQLGGILAQQAEKYVMGVLLASASVGIYNVALNIEQKVYAIVHKLAEVLFPMFSALSNDTLERKANILIKSSWIITSVAVCLLLSVVPFAGDLIRLWMKNPEIADQGALVLQVLCIAGGFGSATTAGYFFLLGVGKTQKITYVSILTGIVTVTVAWLVLPVYGLRGAGVSALVAAIVQSAAISRVMNTALKDAIPLSATLNALYTPILVGTAWACLIAWINPFRMDGWLMLGASYAFVCLSMGGVIFLATRILPHGREHGELLQKLFVLTRNRFLK